VEKELLKKPIIQAKNPRHGQADFLSD